MTEKYEVDSMLGDYYVKCGEGADDILFWGSRDNCNKVCDLLNEQEERIKELEKDVEYWKQVASQYSNELNVFEHCKKYKTECKDIYWDSD